MVAFSQSAFISNLHFILSLQSAFYNDLVYFIEDIAWSCYFFFLCFVSV